MIVLDDVGVDKIESFDFLSAPPYPRTPTIDGLAATGIRFRNFYTNPICGPTRALLMTGRYGFRTGMGTNGEVYRLPDSELFLPELLRQGFAPGGGYRCGAFGKWHLDQDGTHPVTNGFHRFQGHMKNTSDHFVWPKLEQDEGGPLVGPFTVARWSPSEVREDAVDWITAQSEPFFAYVAFNPPHRDWQVPPLATLSPATQAELAGYAEGQRALNADERRLFYRAMLESVDTEIQNLLTGIGPARLANTMVFVVCDNGTERMAIQPPHVLAHGKPSGYELAIRVPLIVSGPLVPQPVPPGGHWVDALVEAVDLWPTIAELTGADVALAFQNGGYATPYPVIDGQSVLPLLLDPSAPGPNEFAYSELFSPGGVYKSTQCLSVHLRAITDGEFKYMRWVDKTGTPPCRLAQYTHELYHLPSDPNETLNLLTGPLTPDQFAAFDHLRQTMDHLSSAPGKLLPR
ncbi:MAG TPA: sulfatase-like hydrolase/transferase [Planctomycetota bacterium]